MTFSAFPTTLSTTFSVLVLGFLTVFTFGPVVFFGAAAGFLFVVAFLVVVVVVVAALGLVTRPEATLLVRGFDVLALVVVLRFVGATAFSICWTRRGLELPLERS
jgi:hypothetical protein